MKNLLTKLSAIQFFLSAMLFVDLSYAAPSGTSQQKTVLSHAVVDGKLASLALGQSTRGAVRALAQQILEDQASIIRSTRRAGSSKTSKLTTDQRSLIRTLSSLRSPEFDELFLAAIIMHRTVDVMELQRSTRASTQMQRVIPLLGQQLVLAQDAQSELNFNTNLTGGSLVLSPATGAGVSSDNFQSAAVLPTQLSNDSQISSIQLTDGSILSCQCPGTSITSGAGISTTGSTNNAATIRPTTINSSTGTSSTSAQTQTSQTSQTATSGSQTQTSSSMAFAVGQAAADTSSQPVIQNVFIDPSSQTFDPLGSSDFRPGGFIGIPGD